MVKQSLILKNNNSLKRQNTVRIIATRLLGIFQDHIGQANAISQGDLFKLLFNKTYTDSLEDWLRWEFVKRGMHMCRKYSHCFIASKLDRTYSYFVVKEEADAEKYTDMLENSIKKMRFMQNRAREAVKKEWYKTKWELTTNEVGKISKFKELLYRN